MSEVVVFGGSGFIGSHFSQFILDNRIAERVIVLDVSPLSEERTTFQYRQYVAAGKISYFPCDVRKPIAISLKVNPLFIANFAAVHREPGHKDSEYYETNLLGAENVCQWAEKIGCDRVIFTSSIAPYGPSEEVRTENSIPVPATAYGGSKLAAEKIHQTWQAKDVANRKLVIVRPGVVFGAGEFGNVSRLIRATLRRYFFYMGNRGTRKAGTYVKELCNAMWWALNHEAVDGVVLFNMSMNPGPTIEEYVKAVCSTARVNRIVPSAPYWFLLLVSYFIAPFTTLLKVDQPISPVRLRKLVKSNNVVPRYLTENGYEYKYDLSTAMVDWKKDKPEEWR